ncbi:MAG: helicase-related protein [Nitrososphaerales archaeon]
MQQKISFATDLTFITNEPGQLLKDRFQVLIKDCRFFDCLVGYFYISGFHLIHKALENTERIRVLIGIGTGQKTYELLMKAREEPQSHLSHFEVKQIVEEDIVEELENSGDQKEIEEGIRKFIEWVRGKKLEIRAYPSRNIHAKLYIMTFREGDRDVGRVITGSSNLTYSGLMDNLEFNVELKNRADYEFAKQKFEELWNDAVDVSERFIQTIQDKTWLKEDITPYELYLKFLYEYFKDELTKTDEVFIKYLPEEFKRFEYQEQAVINAKRILEEYGGVFISDVVGLGKTYIATMLAGQLDGRTLVIAPPALLDRNNPGSWPNVFSDFHIPADFVSFGKLDDVFKWGVDRYKNIIVDEAHRFRTETTQSYQKLAEIVRGKRVILVTATPYNNSPKDILNMISLFQKKRRSTIPNLPDLENFFMKLQKKLDSVDKSEDPDEFIRINRENAKEIRDKVLKYLMVRRTRAEIEKYFADDLKKHNIKFPIIENPRPLFYQFNEIEDAIFDETLKLITHDFTYARYMPLLYLKKGLTPLEEQSQRNMGGFMKVLLVKRLESSFYAFRKSIDRFIRSYEMFINEFKRGNVYISKDYINKIFHFLETGDDEAIQKLIDEGKAERYKSEDFTPQFIKDLENDLEVLINIKEKWQNITRDPKLQTLLEVLKDEHILKNNKLIIFTESKETAEYLAEELNRAFGNSTLLFTGQSSAEIRDKVIENFDARAKHQRDDYRILVSTEVLSEGVNLHRSNVVINYDIPWNPTRMIQRVGRINRIDTKFDRIYTFNFFPTRQSNDQIKLREVAEAKIHAFLTLLGGDAAILTEGEPVGSHELFDKLLSQKTLTADEEAEESELKYLNVIKEIRDKNPDLFERIKKLPKKARTAKEWNESLGQLAPPASLITYFRKGKIQKFYLTSPKNNDSPRELDFLTAAQILESEPNEKKSELSEVYYELLMRNKEAFYKATLEEEIEPQPRRGRDSSTDLLKILKATMKNSKILTEDQEDYLRRLIRQIEEGGIPKETLRKTLRALKKSDEQIANPLKVLSILNKHIPPRFLEEHYAEKLSKPGWGSKREVILSLYLSGRKEG